MGVDQPYLVLVGDPNGEDRLSCLTGVILALELAPSTPRDEAERLADALNTHVLEWQALYLPRDTR